MKVYLAGPMCGCNGREMFDWRDDVIERLNDYKIECIDPTEGLDVILGETDRLKMNHAEDGISNTEVFHSDLYLINTADVFFANLEFFNEKSFGTPFEMGYCYAKGIPIVIVNPGHREDHPFVEVPAIVYDTLDEGVDYLIRLNAMAGCV